MTTDPNARLGRGLNSMVNEVSGIKAGTSAATGGGFLRIPLSNISMSGPGRLSDQTLTESVKKYGVLQPILVARAESGYTLLAGSRRVHAAKEAGLADVPALIIPPDRAGNLDVFIEENLNRADLAASDRAQLRDRWMKETGRDEEQALARVPDQDIWQETEKPPGRKSTSIWMIAAGVMAVVTTVLLIIIFNAKPIDKRTVVIPVEFVEALPVPEPAPMAPPEPDRSWMENFRFPASRVEVDASALTIIPRRPVAQDDVLTPAGVLTINQLAAIVLSLELPIQIEVVATGPTPAGILASAAHAATHLINEGLAADRVTIRALQEDASEGELRFRLSSQNK